MQKQPHARRFRSVTVNMGAKKLRTLIISMSLSIVVMLIIISICTVQLLASNQKNSYASDLLHSLSNESLQTIMGRELPLYASADPSVAAKPPETSRNLGAMVFYLLTNIDIEHPESMLNGQISAMAVSNFKPLIPGFNDSPGEDKLPPQPVQPQPEPQPKPQPEPSVPATGKPLVYIYHTHNRESYLPNLNGETDPSKAYDKTQNITVVGERLANTLKAKGIAAIQTKNDYWYKGDVDNEYDLSRKTVQEVLKKNESIKMVFDIHRDSGSRDRTTAKWNGQDVAKVFFIIGGSNPKKDQNTEFAKKIHAKLEKMYPGISKGVHENLDTRFDTKYNQDLAPNSVLIEIGGPENSLEEACRTAELLANVIAETTKDDAKAASAQ